jgi:hypothetical protein
MRIIYCLLYINYKRTTATYSFTIRTAHKTFERSNQEGSDGHVTRTRHNRNVESVLVRNPEGKIQLGKPKRSRKDC